MPTRTASMRSAEQVDVADRLGETRVTFGVDELGDFFAAFEPLDLAALLDERDVSGRAGGLPNAFAGLS
ncbi:MAG: hypothetical protein AAB426_08680 [Myxococcota bacterium]